MPRTLEPCLFLPPRTLPPRPSPRHRQATRFWRNWPWWHGHRLPGPANPTQPHRGSQNAPVRPGFASAGEFARFRTEAEAIARLQHPNIVQIHEVGDCDGRPFFSLEFCPGGSLEEQLAGTPLSPRAAAALVEQLARRCRGPRQRDHPSGFEACQCSLDRGGDSPDHGLWPGQEARRGRQDCQWCCPGNAILHGSGTGARGEQEPGSGKGATMHSGPSCMSV